MAIRIEKSFFFFMMFWVSLVVTIIEILYIIYLETPNFDFWVWLGAIFMGPFFLTSACVYHTKERKWGSLLLGSISYLILLIVISVIIGLVKFLFQ